MTLTHEEQAARAALVVRQGPGARRDAPAAPGCDLLQARRATAFFARTLNRIDDAALAGPAAGPEGWTRARVVAAVGYDARRVALALEPLRPAEGHLPPEPALTAPPSLDLAATLPPRALRHLFDHSAIHLDVCWRDLPGAQWDASIADPEGEPVPVRALPRHRALTLWRAVLRLEAGATPDDAPEALRDGLAGTAGVAATMPRRPPASASRTIRCNRK